MFSAVYATAVLLALLAQTSPLLFTVGPGLRVDLTLMVVVYFSLFWGWKWALVLGFLTGLCQDALSSEVLGLSALSQTLTAFVVHTLSRHVHVQSLTVQVLFTCLAVAVDTLARLVVLMVFQLPGLALPIVCSTFVQQTLLSTLLAPCVYYALQSAMQWPYTSGQRLEPWHTIAAPVNLAPATMSLSTSSGLCRRLMMASVVACGV